jgi:hypothetical protein
MRRDGCERPSYIIRVDASEHEHVTKIRLGIKPSLEVIADPKHSTTTTFTHDGPYCGERF